ncbi:Uncharacterized protein Rs2_40862 [Raphanus sativus]|nr:Uncharacterized protein Rs2_40862 [Raphanus sativus]
MVSSERVDLVSDNTMGALPSPPGPTTTVLSSTTDLERVDLERVDPAAASSQNPSTSTQTPAIPKTMPSLPANWAKSLQQSTDKKLKKVANPRFSADGTPRIKIPDSVFQKGADLHQDFVIGVFLGKTPAFAQIQSVLSHIWGRGMKLEIHLRPDTRSMLVRIPNSTIRKKIVEQEFWHIGNVLFFVAQWSSTVALQPPTFTSIPLWAHFRGIPFDLYTQEGLGRVRDLLGDPIEVDDFTRRMVDINVAHIKCRVDCTKPLPRSGEIERDNGEVVSVTIDYPWTPPICPCCKALGHLQTHCPSSAWKPTASTSSKSDKEVPNKSSETPPPDSMSWEPSASENQASTAGDPITSDKEAPSLEIEKSSGTLGAPSEVPAVPSSSASVAPLTLPSVDLLLAPGYSSSFHPPSPFRFSANASLPSPPIVDDGILVTPPSSPPSLPSIAFAATSPETKFLPPDHITHLLALPAVHLPRPIIPKSFIKPSLPKSLLSVNPFACLANPPLDPTLSPDLTPSSSSSSPPLTTPAEGSFLLEGESKNL